MLVQRCTFNAKGPNNISTLGQRYHAIWVDDHLCHMHNIDIHSSYIIMISFNSINVHNFIP